MKRLILIVLVLSACEQNRWGETETGAVAGGVIGAGLGAIIGHESGNAGAGVAIGSAIGALGGGLVGNQIESQNDALDQRDEAINRQQQIINENQALINELRTRGVDVRSTDRGVVVNLPDVLFEFNRANLTGDARRATTEIANVLQRYPDRLISIEGHTDSVGTVDYNKRLSQDRAEAVSDDLAAQGVSRRRLRTYGYGESDPIASNRTDAGRQRNRRVEVVIENNAANTTPPAAGNGGFAVPVN